MVRFRRNTKAPDYLGQRFQRRMFLIVAVCGAAFFIVYHAGNPAVWEWLLGNTQSPAKHSPPPQLHARQERPDAAPDAFVAVADEDRPVPNLQDFQSERADELKQVRDNSVRFSARDDRLFYEMLHALNRSTPEQIEAALPETVSYLQLHSQPDAWRAELVRVVGFARLAYRVPVPADAAKKHGIAHLYEVWIQPPQYKDHSFKVYCLELPEAFPLGQQIFEEVEVSGLFFRLIFREKSDDSSELHPNPVILARGLAWTPKPPEAAAPTNWTLIWCVVGGIAFVALGFVYYVSRRRPRQSKLPPYMRKRTANDEIDLAELDDPETDRKVKSSLADLESSMNLPPSSPRT